jgi:hypothetical protein
MNGSLLDRIVKDRNQLTSSDLVITRRFAHPDRQVKEHAVAFDGQLNYRIPTERRARGGHLLDDARPPPSAPRFSDRNAIGPDAHAQQCQERRVNGVMKSVTRPDYVRHHICFFNLFEWLQAIPFWSKSEPSI